MKYDSLKQLMYLEATLAGLLLVLYKGNSFVLVLSTRWYKALSYVLIYFFYEYLKFQPIISGSSTQSYLLSEYNENRKQCQG
jgi:hypothetical protein